MANIFEADMKKTCFVPTCLNSSDSAPNKYFIFVPRDPTKRISWFEAVGAPLVRTAKYCCEDHFNLKVDSIDFSLYKRTRMTPRIKNGIVPHLFLSKPNRDIFSSQLDDSEEKSSESEIEVVDSTQNQTINIMEIDEQAGPSCRFPEGMELETSASKNTSSSQLQTSTEESQIISESSGCVDNEADLKNISRTREKLVIDSHPRFYLGLTSDVYHLVKIIFLNAHIPERDILIVLKKIRLGDTFFRLGLDFGLSGSFVGKIFNSNISKIENVMKHFIFWPDKMTVLQFLPIPFRYRYNKVVSIIDCFEISIEKPSNPIQQALTWSQYKNCNTIKFLISSTPYGFINFISEGYGGRASDLVIVEDCGYLNELLPSSAVLADRGFKHLAPILNARHVELIRPASVSANEQLSEREVRESRNISALRIHIERVISRVREFALLSPHAHIDVHFVAHLNACVTIACGIINLQPELIKMTY